MAVHDAGNETTGKIVKDVVHQFVELPGDLFDTCIDTALMQRLRRVKQLSLAYYVYPGATHTRLEHSLGVAYTMKRAIDAIRENIRGRVLPYLRGFAARTDNEPLRLEVGAVIEFMKHLEQELKGLEKEAVVAALIHDIGHLALSHTAEEALRDKVIEFTPFPERIPAWRIDHEAITLYIARLLSCAYRSRHGRHIDPNCPNDRGLDCMDGTVCYRGTLVDLDTVWEILEMAYSKSGKGRQMLEKYCTPLNLEVRFELGGPEVRILGDMREAARMGAKCVIANLLSHSMDVDRADYILRDSIHSGSMSGIYDINRLYRVMTVVPRLIGGVSQGAYGQVSVQVSLGILEKGASVVENMLLSRIYMYSDVYLHDISMVYSAMASRLLSLLYIVALMIESDGGRGEAGDLARKYPLLRGLTGLHRVVARERTECPENPAEALREAASVLSMVTDPNLDSLILAIASGGAGDLFDYIRRYPERHGLGEGRETGWYREICAAISLLAQALAERRHWSALFMIDQEKTRSLIAMIREDMSPVIDELRRYLTPMVIVSYAKHEPYASGGQAGGRGRILVLRRSNPLVPVDLVKVPHATVVRKLEGEVYSKFLVAAPWFREVPSDWLLRRGKSPTARHLRLAEAHCGPDVEAIIRRASRNAEQLAARLSSIAS